MRQFTINDVFTNPLGSIPYEVIEFGMENYNGDCGDDFNNWTDEDYVIYQNKDNSVKHDGRVRVEVFCSYAIEIFEKETYDEAEKTCINILYDCKVSRCNIFSLEGKLIRSLDISTIEDIELD